MEGARKTFLLISNFLRGISFYLTFIKDAINLFYSA